MQQMHRSPDLLEECLKGLLLCAALCFLFLVYHCASIRESADSETHICHSTMCARQSRGGRQSTAIRCPTKIATVRVEVWEISK